MSQIISSESFTKIQPLISDNYSNVYARLRMKLSPDELELFARPDFPQPNMGQWISESPAQLRTYEQADDRGKEEIAVLLERQKANILPKLAGNPKLKNIFEVPTKDQIYWWRDAGGNMHCLLAQWGFRLYNAPDSVNVIDMLIRLPRRFTTTRVIVHVRYSDGSPAANATFNRRLFNNESEFRTDANGDCDFGEIFAGQKFSVWDRSGRRFDYEVLDGVSDYNAEFDLFTSYRVNVVNQYDEPMKNYDLMVDGQRMRTNNEGAIEVSDVVLTPNKSIKVAASGFPQEEYYLSRDPQSNVFTYRLVVEEKTDYDIKVVNQNGLPKVNFQLNVNGQAMTTGADGMVKVKNCAYHRGDHLNVVDSYGNQYSFELTKDPAENHFRIEVTDPEYTGYSIKVVNQDGEPKPNYQLIVNGQQKTTGADGIVHVQNFVYHQGDILDVVGQDGKRYSFELSKDPNQNRFIIEVKDPINTGYSIKVINQKGQEKPNYPISVDTVEKVTNQNGVVLGNNVEWEEGKTIKVVAQGGNPETFTLQRDPGSNNFIYQIQEFFAGDQMVRVQVLDYDKTPLDNLMVSVKGRDGQRHTAMTDNDGYAEFPYSAFEHGKKTKVEFKVTKEYRKALEQKKKQRRNASR